MSRNGVPWPAWAGMAALVLAGGAAVGLKVMADQEEAERQEQLALDRAEEARQAREAAEIQAAIEAEAAILHQVAMTALDSAKGQEAALAEELSRLRWSLLNERRVCVPEDPPPPQVAEATPPPEPPTAPPPEDEPEDPPEEPQVAEAPEPPAEPVEEEPPVEPERDESVVIALADTPVEPDPPAPPPAPEVAAAPPPPPPPPTPVMMPERYEDPNPPPPPPVVVAAADPPPAPVPTEPTQAPTPTPTSTQPVPPGCPPIRPPEEAPEVLFVLDASGSMDIPYGQRGQGLQLGGNVGGMLAQLMTQPNGPSRISRAREAIAGAIRNAPADVDVGLVTFQDCRDIRDYGYFSPPARGVLMSRLSGIRTGQGTPLADAMAAAGGLIRGGRSYSDPAYMVVVTDGEDSCGGNPCAVAQALKSAFPGLTINVIDLSGAANVQCIANITGGILVRPEGGPGLTDMLRRATGQQAVPAHCLQ